jgi:hypothetical protein
VTPIETFVSLAHELEVDPANQAPRRVMCLPVLFLRGLLPAAEADGWSDGDVERLTCHGRAVIERVRRSISRRSLRGGNFTIACELDPVRVRSVGYWLRR